MRGGEAGRLVAPGPNVAPAAPSGDLRGTARCPPSGLRGMYGRRQTPVCLSGFTDNFQRCADIGLSDG